MEGLPRDVIVSILGFLDGRDIARAAASCRALRDASLVVKCDVRPTRRREDVSIFVQNRAEYVTSLVARRRDVVAFVPHSLAHLEVCVPLEWKRLVQIARGLSALESLRCVAGSTTYGVLHVGELDACASLRHVQIRCVRSRDLDLVVLDTKREVEHLSVLRAPTLIFECVPRVSSSLRLDCECLLSRGLRLRDTETLRISCPFIADVDTILPRRARDLTLKVRVLTMPERLPDGLQRYAHWGPSVIVDDRALAERADTLRHIEVHAQHTIGFTRPLRLSPLTHVLTTLGGLPVSFPTLVHTLYPGMALAA